MESRILAWAFGAALIVAGVLYVRGLQADLAEARDQLKPAVQQGQINQAGAEIGARVAANTSRAAAAAQEAIHDVDQAQDLDSALAQWSRGVDRVRVEGAAPVAEDPADQR
ncbi:MAG: hypothetical protein J7521_20890 [Caulobacter sp.]|nr:hypothetical protein [Caulobacter sp.]